MHAAHHLIDTRKLERKVHRSVSHFYGIMSDPGLEGIGLSTPMHRDGQAADHDKQGHRQHQGMIQSRSSQAAAVLRVQLSLHYASVPGYHGGQA